MNRHLDSTKEVLLNEIFEPHPYQMIESINKEIEE